MEHGFEKLNCKTEEEYRAYPALSYSDLVWLDKSPRHFLLREKLQKETEAMRLGTLLHLGVLEPTRFKNAYCVEPENMPDGTEINKRSSKHREFLAEWRLNNADKIQVSPDQLDSLITMLTEIGKPENDVAQFFTGGMAEVMAKGVYDGVPLKGRCDYFIPNHPRFGRVVAARRKVRAEEAIRNSPKKLFDVDARAAEGGG